MSIGIESCPGCTYSGHSHLEGCPNGIYRPQPESQPQQDAPPIPDDLQQLYFYMSLPAQTQTEHNMGLDIQRLIERIGRAEAALTLAREALSEIERHHAEVNRRANRHEKYSLTLSVARAALAATSSPPPGPADAKPHG